jgi:DNA-binding NarL/FixJ family response regulator
MNGDKRYGARHGLKRDQRPRGKDWSRLRPIIRMVAEGKTNNQIAAILQRSRAGIAQTLFRVYERLNLHDQTARLQLANLWARLSLLS